MAYEAEMVVISDFVAPEGLLFFFLFLKTKNVSLGLVSWCET